MNWDDVNARIRGLGLHLLGPVELAAVAAAIDLPALATVLEAKGIRVPAGSGSVTAAKLEAAVRRVEGNRLALLARWCGGPRVAALAVVYEAEDRRSLRALARGAVEGAAPEARLRGLLPTPTLPSRMLEELARLSTPGAIGTTLAIWGHGLAAPFRDVVGQERPDLLALDLGLARAFADRATAQVSRTEPRLLPDLQLMIDFENVRSALVLTDSSELRPTDCWIPGGQALSRAHFISSTKRANPQDRIEYLIRSARSLSARRHPPTRGPSSPRARPRRFLVASGRSAPTRTPGPSGTDANSPVRPLGASRVSPAPAVNLGSRDGGSEPGPDRREGRMTHDVVVLCRPQVAAGFMLAGLRPVEVESPAEGAALLSRLAERPEVGLVLVEDSIHQSLSEDSRRDLARRPLPMVVPFPGPSWVRAGVESDQYIVELLRRAIGYRVRLR